nr:hypothetical protein [Halomonas socia]
MTANASLIQLMIIPDGGPEFQILNTSNSKLRERNEYDGVMLIAALAMPAIVPVICNSSYRKDQ